MTISGLSSNFYLSDNPIYLTINGISLQASYVELTLSRLVNGVVVESSTPQKLYNITDTLNIDIAPLIKSFIPEPSHNTNYSNLDPIPFTNNSINARITVNEFVSGNSNPITITKWFIRGGKRIYESNQNLTAGTYLTVTDKIPVWDGYPVDYYYTSSTSGMVKSNIIPNPEVRTVKGCNPLYVKFMNSLGGYSYWLFENWETEESNDNQGSILRQSDILDLGNDFDNGITLISKFPARFIPLAKDLIQSKEIYLYTKEDQSWQRISSDNNKITNNPYAVNTKVKLKFKPYHRYNPALIW